MACNNYSPDIQAMGDCRNCGHTYEAHYDANRRIAEVPPKETLIDKIPEELWNADDADDWNINAGCNDEEEPK